MFFNAGPFNAPASGTQILTANAPADGTYHVRFMLSSSKPITVDFQGPAGQLGSTMRVFCGDHDVVTLDCGKHVLGALNPFTGVVITTGFVGQVNAYLVLEPL